MVVASVPVLHERLRVHGPRLVGSRDGSLVRVLPLDILRILCVRNLSPLVGDTWVGVHIFVLLS